MPVLNTAPPSKRNPDAVFESAPEPAADRPSTGSKKTFEPAAAAKKVPVPAHGAISHEMCSLFPEGHTGKYELKLVPADNTHMCEIDYTCPVCGSTFKGLKILTSRLGASTSDPDTRRHYKNFDPIYYEVITCPFCLFSALAGMFNSIEDVRTDFLEDLQIYHNADFRFGTEPDTAAVFAGYYLALICAPQSFSKPQLIEASLLHKLSWMYHDCGDRSMEELYAQKALERYLRGYVELEMSADKEVQLCMVIGELSFEAGNLRDAKSYYYKAKMNPLSPAYMKRRASNRLEDLKDYEQQLKEQAEAEAQPEAEVDPDGKGRLFKHGTK